MKKNHILGLLAFLITYPCFSFNSYAQAFKHEFTVASRGVKFVEVNVPENAKEIKAVISGQTEMLNLDLFGPGKEKPVSRNSTWSNISDWKKPFKVSWNRPAAGTWKIKIEGAVHVGKLDKIKSVSGFLEIFIDGVSVNYQGEPGVKNIISTFPLTNEYQFTIPSRGIKFYEINVPENAGEIRATISGQTEMLNLDLFMPGKEKPVSRNSTWSNISDWKKPFKISWNSPAAGTWKIKIEGAVHVGKLDKIKSVSGLLTITVKGKK